MLSMYEYRSKRIELYLKREEDDSVMHFTFAIAKPISDLSHKLEHLSKINLQIYTPVILRVIQGICKGIVGLTEVIPAEDGWHPPLVLPAA